MQVSEENLSNITYRGRGWPLKIKTENLKVTFHLLLSATHFSILKLPLAVGIYDLRLVAYHLRVETCKTYDLDSDHSSPPLQFL